MIMLRIKTIMIEIIATYNNGSNTLLKPRKYNPCRDKSDYVLRGGEVVYQGVASGPS